MCLFFQTNYYVKCICYSEYSLKRQFFKKGIEVSYKSCYPVIRLGSHRFT